METKTCLKCTVGLPKSCFSEGRNVCNSCRLLQIHKRKEDSKKADKVIVAEKPCTRCLRTTQRSKTGFFKTCNSCWKPRVWNKEKQKESEKKYIAKNIEKVRKKWQKAGKQPNRILRDRLNHRISCAMKSIKTRKDNTTTNYIGCDISFLKKWMEYQFDDTIGWHNYGDWHIDHVTPCASFDLLKLEDQKTCFNWQNLRPCRKEENMEKGNKIIVELIEAHKVKVSKFLEVNPLPTFPGDREKGAE